MKHLLRLMPMALTAALCLSGCNDFRSIRSISVVGEDNYLFEMDYYASYDLDEVVASDLDGNQALLDFVKSRGMACSVYGSQFLLDALYEAGEADYALSLMNATFSRSWINMLRSGSTITMEAWDKGYKSNLDWNHAWGAGGVSCSYARKNDGSRILELIIPKGIKSTEIMLDCAPKATASVISADGYSGKVTVNSSKASAVVSPGKWTMTVL